MWGKRRSDGTRETQLEKLAARAQGIVTALEPKARDEALAGIQRIVEGTKALGVLPDELVNALWQALILFVVKMQTGSKPAELFDQLVRGAPMLEPYAATFRKELV